VRADDNEESLKLRLMEYYKKTSPLMGYYHAKGALRHVDAMADIASIAKDMSAIVTEAAG